MKKTKNDKRTIEWFNRLTYAFTVIGKEREANINSKSTPMLTDEGWKEITSVVRLETE